MGRKSRNPSRKERNTSLTASYQIHAHSPFQNVFEDTSPPCLVNEPKKKPVSLQNTSTAAIMSEAKSITYLGKRTIRVVSDSDESDANTMPDVTAEKLMEAEGEGPKAKKLGIGKRLWKDPAWARLLPDDAHVDEDENLTSQPLEVDVPSHPTSSRSVDVGCTSLPDTLEDAHHEIADLKSQNDLLTAVNIGHAKEIRLLISQRRCERAILMEQMLNLKEKNDGAVAINDALRKRIVVLETQLRRCMEEREGTEGKKYVTKRVGKLKA